MATAFLFLELEKQGQISGPATSFGKEKGIPLISVTHELISPRDVASGQATGKIQSKPVTVVKETDATSAMMLQAMVTNEIVRKAEIKFFSTQNSGFRSGLDRNVYTITLVNGFITQAQFSFAEGQQDDKKQSMIDTISFVYSEIRWNWADGDISVTHQPARAT